MAKRPSWTILERFQGPTTELFHSSSSLIDDKNDFVSQPTEHKRELGEVALVPACFMNDGYHDQRFIEELGIGIRRVNRKPQDFCAIFYVADVDVLFVKFDLGAGLTEDVELPFGHIGHDYIEQPVLVRIVKLCEQTRSAGTSACGRLYGCTFSIALWTESESLLIWRRDISLR